jgi:hypothetical protein
MAFTTDAKTYQATRLWTFVSLAAFILLSTVLSAQSPSFVSFDAPDAGKSGKQGTFPTSISQTGAVAGWYIDAGGAVHGFVRLTSGQVLEFSVPSGGNTIPNAINRHGQVVGTYGLAHSNHTRGFLHNVNRGFTRIDVPDALDTIPYATDDSGNIAGTYDDSAGVWHGFLRASSASYALFDAPGAGTAQSQGTTPVAMNANGEITGFYVDANGQRHGFIRDALGNFTTFDAAGTGTQPTSINLSGEVTGYYEDSETLGHSFLRDSAGNISTIDMPRAIQTFASGLNDQGTVVGEIVPTPPTPFAGFERDSSGDYLRLMPPGANSADAIGINNQGRITGYYVDFSEVAHGFVK